MLGRWAMLGWMAAGCREPVVPAPVPDAPAELTARCTVAEDNALRAWCDLETSPPGAVRVHFAPETGGGEQVREGSDEAAVHRVGLYWMTEATSYRWTAERVDDPTVAVSGTFTTGELPPEAREDWRLSGASSAERFLHVGLCAAAPMGIVTRAEDGATVWYQRFPDATRFVGMQHTEDDTVLALSGPTTWSERTWMGEESARWTRPAGSGDDLHHDLTRHGGYTYVIHSDRVPHEGEVWSLDGVLVFDERGELVRRWSLADLWLPGEPHPRHGVDVSHANSVQVVDGAMVVSLRNLSTVVALEADPAAEDFGAVRWRLEGAPEIDGLGTDFVLTDDGGEGDSFVEQHHATVDAEGRLRLFDNRIGERSRGLVVRLDDGVARVEERYELDHPCSFQGAHYVTEAGNVVLTCGPRRSTTEMQGDTVVWTAEGRCATGSTQVLPRMIPLP